jgi:CubicO group peptidase (beta-lactamase class C family)
VTNCGVVRLGFMRFATFALIAMSGWLRVEAAPRSPKQIVPEIEKYMRGAVEFEKFSGAILVARDGKPILSKGYGSANVELDVANTPKTVFRLASITKQFTAAAILMLEEEGKLKVTDPFCQYLSDCPASWQGITIQQLMMMGSGIPGVTAGELGGLRGLPVPWDQWMEATKKKPLDFAPGTQFRYANSGYTLLGFVIEKLSGKTYGEFLDERIFRPLGMTQSGYENPRRIIRNRATGYQQLPGDPIANVPYAEIVGLYAAGGIYSTTEEMLRWDQALYGERLLSRKSVEEMMTPRNEMRPGKRYGYGFWMSTQHGRREVAHGGNLAGFITYIARYPEDKVTVIVLSNNGRGSSGKISRVLAGIVFGEPYEMPYERKAVAVGAEVLKRYEGEFHYRHPGGKFVFAVEEGRLFVRWNAEPKREMFAESETKFFLKNEDVQFTFGRDGNGVVVDQGDGTVFEVLHAERRR